jgi:hypothetical protein
MIIPPPRLKLFFAKKAPVCVIIRRGPSRYSQMVVWNTETDEITEGQWVKAKVDYLTLNSLGTHAAIGMTARGRTTNQYLNYAVFCRPPYFTALEVVFGNPCTGYLGFTPEDKIIKGYNKHSDELMVNATSVCPFEFFSFTSTDQFSLNQYHHIDGSKQKAEGFDQKLRKVLVEDGCIYAEIHQEFRLIYDSNPSRFKPIITPEWAKDW